MATDALLAALPGMKAAGLSTRFTPFGPDAALGKGGSGARAA